MLQFEKLYQKLDQTTKTTEKVDALVEFFHLCSPQDKVWIIALFTGRRPKRSIPLANLRQWAAEFAQIPQWLFDESYHTVGDLAETISLVLGKTSQNISPDLPLDFWLQHLFQIKNLSEEHQRNSIFSFWNQLSTEGRFLLNKLITGGFRIGVSQALLTQALSKFTDIPKDDLTFRISGKWDPYKTNFEQLILNPEFSYSESKPYPFFLAYPIPEELLPILSNPKDTNAHSNAPIGSSSVIEEEFVVQPSKVFNATLDNAFKNIENWQFEYKWDGIRGQLILRNDSITLWSRGEEIVSAAFPEIVESISSFRGMEVAVFNTQDLLIRDTDSFTTEKSTEYFTEIDFENDKLPTKNLLKINSLVLDGEIIGWDFQNHQPRSFSDLQHRMGRKTVSKKIREEIPCAFLVYDVLEINFKDIRELPLWNRRMLVESIFNSLPMIQNTSDSLNIPNQIHHLILPPTLHPQTWLQAQKIRNEAKTQKAEGVMVKLKTSAYGVGRKRGDWWKWKVEAETIDAVLIYAQRGHGKRANLYTDFTFALKNGDLLTPFAKAYSGLSNAEIEELNKWIKNNTKESFGPVRSVVPFHVFEIGFEAIQKSKRHKSGAAVRFPRILRWRKDKTVNDIGDIQDLLDQAL